MSKWECWPTLKWNLRMIVGWWLHKRLCFSMGTAHLCRMVRLPRLSNEMGAKTDPKSALRGQRVHPFQLFWLAQWISIYKRLSGSFHVFPMKNGVSCNVLADRLVESEKNFAWEEASEPVGGFEHFGKRNPRVDHRFHLYLAMGGRAPLLETDSCYKWVTPHFGRLVHPVSKENTRWFPTQMAVLWCINGILMIYKYITNKVVSYLFWSLGFKHLQATNFGGYFLAINQLLFMVVSLVVADELESLSTIDHPRILGFQKIKNEQLQPPEFLAGVLVIRGKFWHHILPKRTYRIPLVYFILLSLVVADSMTSTKPFSIIQPLWSVIRHFCLWASHVVKHHHPNPRNDLDIINPNGVYHSFPIFWCFHNNLDFPGMPTLAPFWTNASLPSGSDGRSFRTRAL